MKKILLIIFIIALFPNQLHAKKRTITIDIEVLLDGKIPLSGGYINITNQIPKAFSMPSANPLGIRVLNRDGKVSVKLKNINGKGLLDLSLLRDKCDWISDFHDINLNEEKTNTFHIVLNPTSQTCDKNDKILFK